MARQTRRLAATAATITALALLTTGCLSSSDGGGSSSSGGKSDGKVTILGAFAGAEKDAFEASLKDFEASSGITVDYTGDADFATTVKAKVNSGDAPDIGLFPQPGGLLELSDKMTPLDDVIDVSAIKSTLIPGFLEAASQDGKAYGAPMRMAVKSIVWYPKAYEKTGLSAAPTSIQDLASVTDKLKSDTKAPWCMGWEADQSTGWVGTDWLEELVLRVNGPEVYDQWVSHEIPFNDPQIVKALDEFGKIAKTKGEVLGGTKGILNTGFADAMTPAFKSKPDCMFMRQGNFATGFFPENVQKDLDGSVGTFVYPPFDGGYDGQPILGGGDLAAAFNGKDADVKKVMEFITSDKFGGAWAQSGGWLSPHKTFDASQYADQTTRDIAKLATDADVFRFDGSDLMPKEVGSGTFWTGMVDWVGGKSTKDTLDAIEASWPTS